MKSTYQVLNKLKTEKDEENEKEELYQRLSGVEMKADSLSNKIDLMDSKIDIIIQWIQMKNIENDIFVNNKNNWDTATMM